MQPPQTIPTVRIGTIILIAGLMQFVNITDFMMVMPLGPDFAQELGIPLSDIGLIGGVYTLSAAVVGLICALYLDQYARKKALLFCLMGLMLTTLAGAVVWDKQSMILARILAGAFGGPLSSLSISLIADWVPTAERGRAMGKVMGGFAAASVLGVPFGLELARVFSWHAPFIVTGALCFGVWVLVWHKLPAYPPPENTKPIAQRAHELGLMMRSRLAMLSYGIMVFGTFGGFIIIPNISGHLQQNLDFPRAYIGLLYMAGGALSFFGMRIAGKMVDKTSATSTSILFTAILVIAIIGGFILSPSVALIPLFFVMFMVASTGRMVCVQTLSSKIPAPEHRGAFMSIQSAAMHMASALGAYASSLILVEENNRLLYVPTIGIISLAAMLVVPYLFWLAERQLNHPR